MEPIRSTQVAVQFAAPLSPWWLLLALPLVIAAGAWLYRRQGPDLGRGHAAGLLALRLALLALLVVLAFRPSLLWRRVLTYPGRVVLLLDNSASMTAPDTGLPTEDALRWARELGAAAPAPCHELARPLAAAEQRIRTFAVFARETDRATDRFWSESEAASAAITALFDRFSEQARAVTGLLPEERLEFDAIVAQLPQWRAAAQALFTGSRNPPARVYEDCALTLQSARRRLLDVQAALDRRALAAPSSPLRAEADALRAQPRLALLGRTLAALRESAPANLPRLGVECRRLSRPDDAAPLSAFAPADRSDRSAPTDLLTPLDRLLREENPFPLAAVLVFSDGRHHGSGAPAEVARLAAQKQVPLHIAALGAAREPFDLAVLDVAAPPFGVKGAPLDVRVRLKTVLPEPADVRVELLRGGEVVASGTVRAGDAPEVLCPLRLTPAETGRFRYTARVSPVAGEAFPAANNTRDFALHVREDKVRVLLLDWRPRWETRFVLNILQRLDYVDLNALIVIAQKDAALGRGVRQGAWPRDRATLALYDLIVLGDLPPDLLTADEWHALQEAVELGGKTLCFLGGDAGGARPPDAAVARALWPLEPSAAPGPDAALERLCVSAAGRYHPLTALAGQTLPFSGAERPEGLLPETQVLARSAPDGAPVLAARWVGKGATLLVGHDRLWKRLHPAQLAAHTALYVQLVSWAVDGDRRLADSGAPLADRHALPAGEPLLAWLPGGDTNRAVEAVAGDRVVAAAPVVRSHPGAELAYAVLEDLPAEDVRLRLRGRPAGGGPILVTDESPELGFLARDGAFLAALAEGSGGRRAEFTDAALLLSGLAPRDRVEKTERVWRLWDARWVLALLVAALTVEWVWRKWVGLV